MLGLAVSGGPDSLAMLLLAQAAIPGQFEVATVDHGLRPESARECAMVAGICGARGIPHEILETNVSKGNIQAKARAARYDALLDWSDRRDIMAVATAHHADDQAETLLMRLNRGSGVSGLAGVREVTYIGDRITAFIRPLLSFRREELAEVIAQEGLPAVQDPSNTDDRFDRARIRAAIASSPWIDAAAVAASAKYLADADDAIWWTVGRVCDEHLEAEPNEVRFRDARNSRWMPREIVLRVVKRCIANLGGSPRGQDVARLVDRLRVDQSGNLSGVLATVEDNDWVFRPEPPRRLN